LGIVGAPVVFALLTAGVALAGRQGDVFAIRASLAALGVAALVTAILAAPRVSPIASLISGLALAGLASLVAVPGATPGPWLQRYLPATDLAFGRTPGALPLDLSAVAVLNTGAYALAGGILLLASLAPSRWRSRPVTAPELEDEETGAPGWRPALPAGSGGEFEDPSNVSPIPPGTAPTTSLPASNGY